MDKEIRNIRPKLSAVSPLVHWIAIGFAALNLWLAQIIWTAPAPRLVIYNRLFTQEFWACVFIALACGIIYGILANRWNMIRYSLIAGLFVKAIFLYALFALALQIGIQAIEGTVALWLFLVWVQIGAVIFFLPKVLVEGGDDR